MKSTTDTTLARLNAVLWTVQVLLALLFLFAGGMKLVLPVAEMTKDIPLPGLFLRFLAVAEIAGALGLILPGLLRTKPELTPLAAGGLVIIMSGATAIMLQGTIGAASLPAVIGLLAGFVAYGRTRVVPLRSASEASARRPIAAASTGQA